MRLSHIRREYAQSTLDSLQTSLNDWVEYLCHEPVRSPQWANAAIAGQSINISHFRYVLGKALPDVREPLVTALEAFISVFELYATEKQDFPAIDLTKIDINTIDEDYVRRVAAGEIDTGIDASFTCSENALRALHLAAVVGTPELRSRLMALIERIKGMELAKQSEHWSNRIEVDIVECLMDYLHGAPARKLRPFGERMLRGNEKELWYETQSLFELGRHEASAFLKSLDEWLAWNAKRATDESNLDRSHFYYSLPALACSKLAVEQGLIELRQLPGDNVFLPLGLLENASIELKG